MQRRQVPGRKGVDVRSTAVPGAYVLCLRLRSWLLAVVDLVLEILGNPWGAQEWEAMHSHVHDNRKRVPR
jgi:hypothetical protein